MRRLFFLALMVGCGDKDGSGTGDDSTGDCVILEDRSCGYGAGEGEDTACPDGFACWGPSAFQCYQGDDCNLPICLSADARIATPKGEVVVSALSEGQLVWTMDALGRRVAVPALQVDSTPAPRGHELVAIELDDGRALRASPGHPTADGREFGQLKVGDRMDGARVSAADRVPYGLERTWDLLPAGATGTYWADGVRVGSTLNAGASQDRRTQASR